MKHFDGIIFDLDGTLWNTQDSYLYAYSKIVNNNNLKVIHDNNYILSTMGTPLKDLADLIFKEETKETQIKLLHEALLHSLSHLMQNPPTFYEGCTYVLETLAKECKLFIVSNCPKEYIDTFLLKANIDGIIHDYRYLKDSESKLDNVSDIIKTYKLEHVLLVGDSEDDYNAIISDDASFVYAAYGYRKCDKYDYKINKLTDLLEITNFVGYRQAILENCPFYKLFSVNDASVVIMKNPDQKETDYIFGFWRYSDNNSDNYALFEQVFSYLKDVKAISLTGPIDYASWYTYRLAINNYNWKLYPDINNTEADVNFLQSLGFEAAYTYASTLSELDYRTWKRARKITLDSNYRIVQKRGKEALAHLADIYEITTDCFAGEFLYTPISYEDFIDIYMRSLKGLSFDLILIYDQNNPIAFSFCYEDPNKQYYISKTVGVKKAYQHNKILFKLVDLGFSLVKERGYDKILHHFQKEQIGQLKSVWKDSVIKQKRYALFKRSYLDEESSM